MWWRKNKRNESGEWGKMKVQKDKENESGERGKFMGRKVEFK